MLMFHSCAVVIATVIQNGDKIDCDASTVSLTILRMGIHCLRVSSFSQYLICI